jgi:hypothetical protein
MKRIAFVFLALPLLAQAKDSWKSGLIKVVNTDEWCARPGIPDSPELCGPPGGSATTLFGGGSGDVTRPATPYSQVLEIDAGDAIYTVKRTSFDGGLEFAAGAVAQFEVDGKHMTIKFDRHVTDRRGETHVEHDRGRMDILQIRNR